MRQRPVRMGLASYALMLDEIERKGSMKLIPVKRGRSLRADRQSAASHPAERIEGGFDHRTGRSAGYQRAGITDPRQTAGINSAAVSSCPRPCENHSAGHLRARLIQTRRRSRIKDSPRQRVRFYCCVKAKASSVFTQPGPEADFCDDLNDDQQTTRLPPSETVSHANARGT
jgi:hypothetical protein